MSSTLLRSGLWLLIIVLALYVLHESFEDQPIAELVPFAMLQKALIFGAALVVTGLVLRMFEKGAKVVAKKSRCAVCRTPVSPGQFYCREHLRGVLSREDERTHMTRIRKS
jgi:predicted nucleic acid-binding Zn ribbon protein